MLSVGEAVTCGDGERVAFRVSGLSNPKRVSLRLYRLSAGERKRITLAPRSVDSRNRSATQFACLSKGYYVVVSNREWSLLGDVTCRSKPLLHNGERF